MVLGSVLKRLFKPSRGHGPVDLSAARTALAQGRTADAATAVSEMLRMHPDHVEGYALRAAIATQQRRFKAALVDYQRALTLQPHATELRLALGSVLHRLGRFEDALAAMERALLDAPDNALVHMNRGLMLRELARFAEAEAPLAQACLLDPSVLVARCHLASVVYDLGRIDDAKEILRAVLREDSAAVEAHWVLAMIALGEGDFEAGWEHYAFRLERHDAFLTPRELPDWSLDRRAEGSVLVLAEQGLGDEIMFASCFADLAACSPGLTIECDPRLGALFARSFPYARIDATRNPERPSPPVQPGISYQVPAGSLPSIYRRRIEQFPQHQGYLRAAPERVLFWRERLNELGPGLKVGISWTGGSLKTRRKLRSVSIQELAPILAMPGVQFVNLQYGPANADLEGLDVPHGTAIAQFPGVNADYDETASLVSALDLVISVTTAIVHLTGALGRPVWVLVPVVAEWRYQRSGSAMPWYPSARLYRQKRLEDWQPVVEAVARDLRAEVATLRAHAGP